MSKVIWKYQLGIKRIQYIELPCLSEILCVQIQDSRPQMWVLLDPKEKEKYDCEILIIGTGHIIEMALKKYIGTFQLIDSRLVFHVFNNT